MDPIALSHYTAVSALGRGVNAHLRALRERRSGLRPNDFERAELPTWIGRVPGLEDVALDRNFPEYDCRNHRLAQLALRADGFEAAVARARARHGAARIGVVIGTSTSGILETETGYARRDPASGALPACFGYRETHNMFAAADFLRRALHLEGPALGVSTACSSGAKAFAVAARWLATGLADAVVAGGVDSLCSLTLYGFHSLELLSPEPCRPGDTARRGISIGEAAAFALLERGAEADVLLLGYGESGDAHHMSSPHPEGEGARLAMARALDRAGLSPGDVDYVNLHGTATPANDLAEDRAVAALFGDRVPASSTKGWTGHTLGAAGALEAVIAALCVRHGLVPGALHCERPDPAFRARLALANEHRPVRRVLSNSFGFGGNNCSLLLGSA